MSLGDCLPDASLTRELRAGVMKSFCKAGEGQHENHPGPTVVADWILTPGHLPAFRHQSLRGLRGCGAVTQYPIPFDTHG